MLVCPGCKSDLALSDQGQTISCVEKTCGANYPLFPVSMGKKEAFIPLLFKNSRDHLAKLRVLMEKRPSWYNSDQIASKSNSVYSYHLEKRKRLWQDTMSDHLQSFSPKDLQSLEVADLGCGDGQNLEWFLELGCRVHAIDYNPFRVAKAQENAARMKDQSPAIYTSTLETACASIDHLPFPDRYIHLILCNHVLEHVQNVPAALSELHRVLHRDGLLVIGVPNEGSEFWQLAYKLDSAAANNTDHVQFFTVKAFSALCERAGFSIDSSTYIGYGIPHFAADDLFRRKMYESGVKVSTIEAILDHVGSVYFHDQAIAFQMSLRKGKS